MDTTILTNTFNNLIVLAQQEWKWVLTAIIGLLVIIIVAYCQRKRSNRKRLKSVTLKEKGIVYLYGFPRSPKYPYSPNASPFVLKLETYLRMAQIPYCFVPGMQMSSKGKFPWIEYNGVQVADTDFCIDHLIKEIGNDANLDTVISTVQRAESRALRKMLEECTYFVMVHMRWVQRFEESCKAFVLMKPPLSWLVHFMFKREVKKTVWGQGMGRHSPEEIAEIGRQDLKAVSDFLRDKPFIMGPEPTRADATVFAFVVCAMSPHFEELNVYINNELKNLVRYVERVKKTFFPDWELLLHTNPKDHVYRSYPIPEKY